MIKMTKLSIIIPAFNEEEVLPEFHNRISKVLKSMSIKAEIVYVNDGSTDGTLKVNFEASNIKRAS